MEKEKELYEVFTLKLMNYLAQHGFYVVSVMDDLKNPHYKTFLFRNTKELKACIEEYKRSKR